MPERIKLPLLTGFRINGFEPIYSTQIEQKMGAGPYVVLGGNGLGKTTLMQAVVYGLAGGLDDKVEDIKAERWTHSYFRGRLNPAQVGSAQVEVDFKLGSQALSIRRGFRGSNVLAVRQAQGPWIEDDAQAHFVQMLRDHGGYLDPSDFSFVVHRLLYLPENRRDIAWDTDAQIRLLMLLNQDIGVEREFRENRATLKLLDSKKRHIHVALGKAERELATLLEYEDNFDGGDEAREDDDSPDDSNSEETEAKLPDLVARLNEVGQSRLEADRRGRDAVNDLSRVSDEIDSLRTEIEGVEAALVANFLAETERDHQLALGKLLSGMICPACGQKHTEMASRARQFLREHKCVLCGTKAPHDSSCDTDSQRRKLSELIREQQAYEQVVRLSRAESDDLRQRELKLQDEVNRIRFSRSVVAMVERNLPQMTVDNLKELKANLANEEADTEAQIITIRHKLDNDYQSFRMRVNARMESLRTSYAGYATSFLGLPCTLDEVEQNGLMALKLFVPNFDGAVRAEPESCSEAQRFFLDIAFRMALIDLACGSSGTGTFICETPETALDFSYVKNVVSMFVNFAKRQHNILLSANIQTHGIAEKLIVHLPVKMRASHIVNLLNFGRLSAVQKDSKKEFGIIVRRMLSSPQLKS